MERKQEFTVVDKAIKECSIRKIKEVCQMILSERIKTIRCHDKEIQQLAEKIISTYSPFIEIKLIEIEEYVKHKHTKNDNKIICGGLGFLGLILSFVNINWSSYVHDSIFEINWMGLGGCIIFGISTIWATHIMTKSKPQKKTINKYIIKQTVDDVIIELDNIFDSLKRLLMHNQLESKYLSILKWLQVLWAESDKDMQKDISKLLNRINYEIVDYSAELSEYFDANKVNDIEKPVTTRPALKNKFTGDIVERGYVIIPMSNN